MASSYLDWLQTLADATRVRLLSLLDQQELSVSELCCVVQLPQSTVSRHLKVLAGQGWINNRREGTNQLYSIERSGWNEARQRLFAWLKSQQESSVSSAQDRARLFRVLAQRSSSEAFFQSAAAQWDRLRVELFGVQLDAHILAASLSSDWTVAELGCGSAPLAQLVAPYVRQVVAIDNSSAMLSAARQRLAGFSNVRIEQASLAELPVEDETCDAAWLVMVLPYIEDPAVVVKESARILKPSAPLVVVDLVPHDRHAYRQEMGHLHLGIAKSDSQLWFEQAGLIPTTYHALPPDPEAKGPALFAAVGKRRPRGQPRDPQGESIQPEPRWHAS